MLPDKIKTYIEQININKNEKSKPSDKEIVQPKVKDSTWIDWAAQNAKSIKCVTHPIKFSHPDARGTSINALTYNISNQESLNGFVYTHPGVTSITKDFTCNAALLKIVGFLQLDDDAGKTLMDYIIESDASPLQPFADDSEQLNQWMANFKNCMNADTFQSHSYVKQFYFPVQKEEYHLLSHLFASSLTFAIYEKINTIRFGKQFIASREAKNKNQFDENLSISFPNLAKKKFGGSKTQNISKLNAIRRGVTYLLNTAPPRWKNTFKPPLRDIFSKKSEFEFRSKDTFEQLPKLLKTTRNNVQIRAHREKLIDNIIDILLNYASNIQALSETHAGWSVKSNLPRYQQLWLDPQRTKLDPEFSSERSKYEWIDELSKEFSRWLNYRLEAETFSVGSPEFNEWYSLLNKKICWIEKTVMELS